jgi:hypothetical protein
MAAGVPAGHQDLSAHRVAKVKKSFLPSKPGPEARTWVAHNCANHCLVQSGRVAKAEISVVWVW